MRISVRYMMVISLILLLLFARPLAAQPNPYNAQVNAGVTYFRQLANEQLLLAENLLSALKSGDVSLAKDAYVKSRPPLMKKLKYWQLVSKRKMQI